MGRRKLRLEKLPSEQQRKSVYRNRSKGVMKKANELSVMCDVEVCILMFSCTGKPEHFSSQPGIWKIIQRFIESSPENARMQLSQDNIDFVNKLASEHNRVDGSSMAGAGASVLLQPDRENEQKMEAGMREPMLQHGIQYVGTGYLNSVPLVTIEEMGTSNACMSDLFYGQQQEWMLEDVTTGYEAPIFNGHQNVRDPVLAPLHGEYVEKNTQQGMDISADVQPPSSAWRTQIPNATESNIQPNIASRREQFESQLIYNWNTFNPAISTQMPMQQPHGAPEAGMWGPLQGGEYMQQLRRPELRMGNQSLPSVPIFGAHRNIDNSNQNRLNQAYYKDITKLLMDDT